MPNDDKNFQILLLQKVSEIGERTARMEVEQRNMKEDLEEIKRQDVTQNELLDQHIAGVETQAKRLDNEIMIREQMREDMDLTKSRVTALEEAPKFRATLKQYVIGAGAIAGAIVGIAKLLKMAGLL